VLLHIVKKLITDNIFIVFPSYCSFMLDEKDRRILEELKKNARNPTKKIASIVKIPRVTVADRIKKMKENNIIKSFTILPNYSKIGLDTTIFVFVSKNPYGSKVVITDIAKQISKLPGVYEIHIVSGEYDLLLKIRGKTFKDIGEKVLAEINQIEGVGRTFTIPCFNTLKEEM
jgi:Lrp/AsnC family leucine-responsive transcriptional regulator